MAEYINENFVCTFLKVGTFQIVNGQKQGGNVASYFCLGDGRVVHAVAGQVGADKLLSESRWAYEIRKSAVTFATDLGTGKIDEKKYRDKIVRGHTERYNTETNTWTHPGKLHPLPARYPDHVGQQAQTSWLLATKALPDWRDLYPTIWTRVLNEQLSDVPVAKR